ncbi:MAG: hypothetical protein JWP00_3057 [Chloroflexi bacterium]|jgi:hypothetical protein|nr:hypothetical protein [Chloroflexota bacterium]
MEIVVYQDHFDFHFWAGLRPAQLVEFLNSLPLGFQFKRWPEEQFFDTERGPGVFSLHQKISPTHDKPIPVSQANYFIRWTVGTREGNLAKKASRLAGDLSRELETHFWVVDGRGRVRSETGNEGVERGT